MNDVFIFTCIPTLLKGCVPFTVRHNKALPLVFVSSSAKGAKTFEALLSHEIKSELDFLYHMPPRTAYTGRAGGKKNDALRPK